MRVVLDTNTLVSRILAPQSAPAKAVDYALAHATVLLSEPTLAEIARVLGRSKFDRYVTVVDRQAFIQHLAAIVEMVPVARRVQACRDPKDDIWLELAVNGAADVIVTGDSDLLVMHPFLGVDILGPVAYLGRGEAERIASLVPKA